MKDTLKWLFAFCLLYCFCWSYAGKIGFFNTVPASIMELGNGIGILSVMVIVYVGMWYTFPVLFWIADEVIISPIVAVICWVVKNEEKE